MSNKLNIDYFDSDPWTGVIVSENGIEKYKFLVAKPFEDIEEYFNRNLVNYTSAEDVVKDISAFDKN